MFTIGNVKPETVVALIGKLRSNPDGSVVQNGNQFIVSGRSALGRVVGQFAYDPKTQSIAGTVLEKPMLVPESMIESKLRQQIDEVQA